MIVAPFGDEDINQHARARRRMPALYAVLSLVASRAARVKSCIPRTEYRRKAPLAEYSDAFWSEIAKTFDAGEDLG